MTELSEKTKAEQLAGKKAIEVHRQKEICADLLFKYKVPKEYTLMGYVDISVKNPNKDLIILVKASLYRLGKKYFEEVTPVNNFPSEKLIATLALIGD